MMKFTQQQINDVLAEITRNTPRELYVWNKERKFPVLNFLARKLLRLKGVDEEVKAGMKAALSSGKLAGFEADLTEESKNKLNEYWGREIKKAIDAGRLPDPKNDPFIQKLKRRKMKYRHKYK